MLPPLNLLALDTTAFDADFRTWHGTQAEDSGFRATFAGLQQSPAPAEHALSELSPDISGMLELPTAEGGPLPQAGNALPLSDTDVARDETPSFDPVALIAENPGQLRPSVTDEPGGTGTFAAPEAELSAAGLPDRVTAAAFAEAQSGNSQDRPTKGPIERPIERPIGAGQATILNHIRYLPPDTGARAPAATAAADPALDATPPADVLRLPHKNPVATGGSVRQLVQQIADPMQAKAGHAATDALLPVDLQDARPAQASATALPFASATATTASSSPTPWVASQWVASQIHASPGKPGWNEALGERVMWMAGNKLQNVELRLNPAELGPMRVQISIDDGNATVNFSAQHPLTRDAIEQALPRLREMLADQGLSLQDANVSGQGKEEERSGPGNHQDAAGFASDRSGPAGRVDENARPAAKHAAGLVDLFA